MPHLSHISPLSSPRARGARVSRVAWVLALFSAAVALGCGEDATAPAASKDPTAPALATTRAADAAYTVQDLGTLGGPTSEALAISAADAVVGWSSVARDAFSRGFLWKDGVMTELASLGGAETQATGINRAGEIAGWSRLASGDMRAVRWTHGVIQNLGTLGGASSQAFGINDFGVIVGRSQTASGDQHAFVWEDGVMTDIGTLGGTGSVANAVNHHGVVVGLSGTASGAVHAFRWQDGAMQDLGTLGAHKFSAATAINAKGDIVGTLGPQPDAEGEELDARTPFLLSRRGVVTILPSPHVVSRASGISPHGVVVGSAEDLRSESATEDSWIWEGGADALLPELSVGNSAALGINQAGDIAGYSETAAGHLHAAMWRRTGRPAAP
jgi:probable HAF family extracellular repeat protein